MRHVILNLHGIATPGRALEPDEDRYWISVDQFQAALTAARNFAARGLRVDFTFDDGNLSDLDIAAEPLARAGFVADIFVLSARLDHPGSLSVADLRTLQDMGHRIGTHGQDHVDWTALDDAGRRAEWYDARATIAEAAQAPVTAAAIPFGRYNGQVLRGLKAAGYDRVYSSHGGAVGPCDWPIPRTSLRGDMTQTDLEAIFTGTEPLRRRLRRAVSKRLKRVI